MKSKIATLFLCVAAFALLPVCARAEDAGAGFRCWVWKRVTLLRASASRDAPDGDAGTTLFREGNGARRTVWQAGRPRSKSKSVNERDGPQLHNRLFREFHRLEVCGAHFSNDWNLRLRGSGGDDDVELGHAEGEEFDDLAVAALFGGCAGVGLLYFPAGGEHDFDAGEVGEAVEGAFAVGGESI